MLTILLRTLIIYLTLVVTMRVMGKRQLGELEVSELVTTLLLSEVASLPITNQDIPLAFAIVPVLTLMSLELLLHVPVLKKALSVRPTILIRHGKPDAAAMKKSRISAEELFSHLRQKGVSDPDQVEYAIAEPNGQLSVALRATERQATTRELGIDPPEPGIMHLIIHDGVINDRNLTLAGRDRRWLDQLLAAHRLTPDRVFLLLTDDGGTVRILPRRTS